MILQALVGYYERRRASADQSRHLPDYGWIRRPLDYVVVLRPDGECVAIEFIGTVERGQRRGQARIVPAIGKQALKHTNSGTDANLLWDGARFVLAAPGEDDRRPRSFLHTLDQWLHGCADPGVQAVRSFVAGLLADPAASVKLLQRLGVAEDFAAREPVLAFRLDGDVDLVHERIGVRQHYESALLSAEGEHATGPCLVSGEQRTPIASNETVIKGVQKAQTSGANIVSFNADAFLSYGGCATSSVGAPIGRRASFAYTTALNELLDFDSPNKVQIGDATTVIWADREDPVEGDLVGLFDDDPDAHVDAVKRRLAGAAGGTLGAEDTPLRFFVLGLAPNASRIAVRFWVHDRFDRLGPRILQHFDDLRIVRQSDKDSPTPSIYWLLRSIAPQGKPENVPPRLAGEWLRTILEGAPYPPALLNAAVNRCRAEQAGDGFGGNVPYLRAAILKACINREHRRRHGSAPDFQYVREELDVSQLDPAYRLGRLFAVLERIQSAAQPGINATIRDRYYGAASSTPGAVFPTLMRLKNAHLKKLAPGMEAYFEKLVGDICGSLEQPALADFPRQLDLHAQGLFALGYYHQRQSLYTRKEATPDNDNPAQED
ncbi:MAG: type I-C CRISPR-associated protein Cas8c/Csd1 [Rubrivivax sp.]|nr:type I-C CRISPR-associated protein Cas8c/Csd1 [Rubrivivax sp.]